MRSDGRPAGRTDIRVEVITPRPNFVGRGIKWRFYLIFQSLNSIIVLFTTRSQELGKQLGEDFNDKIRLGMRTI